MQNGSVYLNRCQVLDPVPVLVVIKEQNTKVGRFNPTSQTAEFTVCLIAIQDILVELEAVAGKRPASVSCMATNDGYQVASRKE